MDKNVIIQKGYADMFKKLKNNNHYVRLGKLFATEHKKYFMTLEPAKFWNVQIQFLKY